MLKHRLIYSRHSQIKKKGFKRTKLLRQKKKKRAKKRKSKCKLMCVLFMIYTRHDMALFFGSTSTVGNGNFFGMLLFVCLNQKKVFFFFFFSESAKAQLLLKPRFEGNFLDFVWKPMTSSNKKYCLFRCCQSTTQKKYGKSLYLCQFAYIAPMFSNKAKSILRLRLELAAGFQLACLKNFSRIMSERTYLGGMLGFFPFTTQLSFK